MGSSARRGRRRWLIIVVALVLTAAAVVFGVGRTITGGGGGGASAENGSATGLATVQRRSLSTQTQFTATLGYAGSYPVLGRARGTVTGLPEPGQVIGNGQVLYRVDGAPVVLLYGSTPAYRTLAARALASEVTGLDVAQLNRDLVSLGLVHEADVASGRDQFNWATTQGVERLQRHLGAAQTGRLELGAVVFLPAAARITTLRASLGGPAAGMVLQTSSTRRAVSVALDASLQSEVKAGDRVTITLPNGLTTPGTVTSVGRVASGGSNGSGGSGNGPTVPVTIRPGDPAATGTLDQAPVEVSITNQSVGDVLAVPVDALLALAGGGYAVDVVASDGTHHLVRASTGLFDDAAGMIQVSGTGLAAGQHVVVPGNA